MNYFSKHTNPGWFAQIHQRIQQGDQQATEELCGRLFKWLCTILKRDFEDYGLIEDTAIEATLATHKAILEDRLEDPEKILSYATAAAIRIGNNKEKRISWWTSNTDKVEACISDWVGPEKQLEWDIAVQLAYDLISQLKEIDREIILRLHLHNESVTSVSQSFGQDNQWVYRRVHRARKKLEELYRDY